MDLCPSLLSACIMMGCLIGAPCCDQINFPCPEIPVRNLTEPPPRACFQIDDKFRYTCIAGYLRKAGTSSLTRCKWNNSVPQWTPASLQCIPDPRRTTAQPPKTTVTTFPGRQRSRSVSARTGNADSPSPGGPVPSDPSQVVFRTTSTSPTAGPSNSTDHRQISKLSSTATTSITVASLLIICALIGISFLCYRRMSNSSRTQLPTEEQIPMNQAPSAQV